MNILAKRPLAVLAAGLIGLTALVGAAKADVSAIEQKFDAAAWPKQLKVEVEQTGPDADDLAIVPDQTRKAMVRDLVESGRLVGMRFSDVRALLGEGQMEDGVLFYALGDQPIGDYNPIVLGVLFDPIGRVAAAKAVHAE
jgi:hypothetical protein